MDWLVFVPLTYVFIREYFYNGCPHDVILLEVLTPFLLFLFVKTVLYVLQLGDETYQVVFFFAYVGFVVLYETEVSDYK